MKTIGNRIPTTVSRNDYPCRCDYCGVPWYRSQLRVDGAGKLYCPQEGDGLDAVTLNEIDAAERMEEIPELEPRDGTFAKLPLQATPPTLESIVGSGGRT